jgi:hypothetical protein
VSVARCREINARLRGAGITVYEWPGWESRGNGQSSAYEGGTAPAVLVDGRSNPPLAGPLANYSGNADGSITVLAAHPANHAGASGGRSMGPLPVTATFNRRVLGLEIVYPGTVPMRDAQYRAALVWARVVADVVGGGDIQRVRAHGETSITGKWDPGDAPGRTINMAAFRAAAVIVGGNDHMDPNNPHDSAAMGRLQALSLDEEIRSYGNGAGEKMESVINAKSAYGRMQAAVGMLPQVVWGPASGERNALAEFLQGLKADLFAVKAGVTGLSDDEANLLAAIQGVQASVQALADGNVDEAELAALLAPALAPLVELGVTESQVEAAMRRVFASAATPEGSVT